MLLGRFATQISKKGRLALPSRFRKETGNKIIIARWYEECLVIVGFEQWNRLLLRFADQKAVVTKPIRSVERFILSTAFEAETDAQGRFVVPGFLRSLAKLDKEVIFLGLGERIELWSLDVWQKEEVRVISEADKMLETISDKKI